MANPAAKQAAERPVDNVLSAVHVLANLIGEGFADHLETAHGLTVAEWRVMLTLGREPGLSAAEITTRWAMDKMAISRAIKRLTTAGMIARKRNPRDGRSYHLSLTRSGRARHKAALPGATLRYREFVACLNKTELTALRRALAKLIDHAETLR
ncbi:MAG: MarR family transcriptional regulator [Alphaproteobacteria bacterium]